MWPPTRKKDETGGKTEVSFPALALGPQEPACSGVNLSDIGSVTLSHLALILML